LRDLVLLSVRTLWVLIREIQERMEMGICMGCGY
jgi:hypothetical protein